MPILYDSYQLENSKLTKPYQGSTLNELIKVSDVMQDRYDASTIGIDQIDEFLKNVKALPQDTPLLKQRVAEYKNKIAEWSGRKDLENVTRDVYKAGKQLANEYKNFSDNMQRSAAYQKEIEDAVQKGPANGGISRTRADQLLRVSHTLYKGMKYNPEEGYQGQFTGVGAAPEVDHAEWIKKVVGDIAEKKGGSVHEGPAGDYFIKTGNTYERITKDMIDNAITAGFNLDERLQADFTQRANLSAFEYRNATYDDLPKELADEAKSKGLSPQEAMLQYSHSGLMSNLRQLGYKYAKNNSTSLQEYNGMTIEGQVKAHKLTQPDTLLSLSTTTPGSGTSIKTATDFDKTISTTQKEHDKVFGEYRDWLKDKVRDAKGHIYKTNPDGTRIDVTDEAEKYRGILKRHRADLDNLEEIKNEAAKEAGYDPKKTLTPKLKNEAKGYAALMMTTEYSPSVPPKMFGMTPEEKADYIKAEEQRRAEATTQYENDYISKHSPGYSAYEQKLKSKLNKNAESSSISLIQDPQVKKAWSENITALTSDLGLKDGAIAFTIGSGPDQGKQISASQYKGIQGDVEVIGFETAKDGTTQIKVRAFKDVKGAKTKGKDLLLNLGHTDVDKWLEKNMSPEEFDAFKNEGWIKQQLNNKTRRAEVPIPGTRQKAKIRLENDQWVVSFPGEGGQSEQIAMSYMGIVDLLYKEAPKYIK